MRGNKTEVCVYCLARMLAYRMLVEQDDIELATLVELVVEWSEAKTRSERTAAALAAFRAPQAICEMGVEGVMEDAFDLGMPACLRSLLRWRMERAAAATEADRASMK